MDRMRMPRINRAAQFAPFDALKGLQEALRVKEFEHDKIAQSELSEEQAKKLSKILLEFEKGDVLEVTYFKDDVEWNYYITSNFLISKITSRASNFTSSLTLEYPKTITIEYPNGLDFITLDIDDAKKLLEVDNFAHLIDPDLKEK